MSDADSATSDDDFELEDTFGGDDDDDDDDDDIAPRGAGKRSKVPWRMCDSLLRRGKSTSQIEEWLLERLKGLSGAGTTKGLSYTRKSDGARVTEHKCSLVHKLGCPWKCRVVETDNHLVIEVLQDATSVLVHLPIRM